MPPSSHLGVAPTAHPTVFELRSFGTSKLSDAQALAVLRHLDTGCFDCLATLAPSLLPWLDDEPAAEAGAIASPPAGKTLAREYRHAAARAARAVRAERRPGTETSAGVRAVTAHLAAEGLQGLRRLSRRQLARPAIHALLHLIENQGRSDPQLRLGLAEVAADLAAAAQPGTAAPARLAELRERTAVELANAHRCNGSWRAAYETLIASAAARRQHDPQAEPSARWFEIYGKVMEDQRRFGAAHRCLALAAGRARRLNDRRDLARISICRQGCASESGDHDAVAHHSRNALRLLAPDRESQLVGMVWHNLALDLLRAERWREALPLLHLHRDSLAHQSGGRNAAYFLRTEGRILDMAGDLDAAGDSFDACARQADAIRAPYTAAVGLLQWADMLARSGDSEQALHRVRLATDRVLGTQPHREIHVAMVLLRGTFRFASTRNQLPLLDVIDFLQFAEFNPGVSFQAFRLDTKRSSPEPNGKR